MNQIVLQKLDRKTFAKAQLMYFGDRSVEEIAMVLAIEPETLRYYIFGEDGDGTDSNSWYKIKKRLNPTAMAIYLKDKVHVLEQTAGIGLEILNVSLGRLRDTVNDPDSEVILSIDDMGKLAKIVVDMDKMVRLESGQATELIEHMGLSRAEAKEILANDPFAQEAVEVDSIELPWLAEESKDGEST